MKYILLLACTSLVFTGCFSKPVVEDEVSPESTTQTSSGETELPEQIEDSNTTQTGASEELNEENTENTENTDVEEEETENTGSTSTGAEKEIIEEYEDDLEELFNDILGS